MLRERERGAVPEEAIDPIAQQRDLAHPG